MALKATKVTGPHSPPLLITTSGYATHWTYAILYNSLIGSGATEVSFGALIRATPPCKLEIDNAHTGAPWPTSVSQQFGDVAERSPSLS
jgi:hypothetical protein